MPDFQEYLQRPGVKVRLPIRLRVNEVPVTLATREDVADFADRYFRRYSYVERKFLHFKLVDQLLPQRCRH